MDMKNKQTDFIKEEAMQIDENDVCNDNASKNVQIKTEPGSSTLLKVGEDNQENFLKENMEFEQKFIKVESKEIESNIKHELVSEDDGDYKFHTEFDLDEGNDKLDCTQNAVNTDVYDNDTGIGISSTVTSRMQETNNSEEYRCKICPDKVYTVQRLHIYHMKTKHNMYPETNTADVDGASSICVLKQRTIAHVCEYCQKSFTSKSKLDRHVRIHTGERPYKCDTCGRAFTQASNLQSHMAVHSSDTVYTCYTCNNTFKAKRYLRDHMLVHSKDKPHKCNLCSKTFKKSCALQVHHRTHTDYKPYTCNICNKAFAVRDTLQKHLRLHTSDEPHTCNVCNKVFAVRGTLQRHLRVHTGAKPYTCNVCNKAFAESGTLRKHTRIHTGDKPYTCNVCNKAFAENGNLRRHLRIHTGQKR